LEKSSSAFRTISEVAEELAVPKHVLRFWEGKFSQLRPMKRGGGRRYYRPEDVDLLRGIRWLLYDDGYTIKGVQRILRGNGVRFVKDCWREQSTVAEPQVMIPDLAEEAATEARRGKHVTVPANAHRPKSSIKVPDLMARQDDDDDEADELLLAPVHRLALVAILKELEECRDMLRAGRRQ
jgi:DNA-binding transcriptional MerR regulator